MGGSRRLPTLMKIDYLVSSVHKHAIFKINCRSLVKEDDFL